MRESSDRLSPRAARALVYLLTLLFSAAFFFAGNRLAAVGGGRLPPWDDGSFLSGTVGEILSREVIESAGLQEGHTVENVEIRFTVTLADGGSARGIQTVDGLSAVGLPEVAAGDRVTLVPNTDPLTAGDCPYRLDDYRRLEGLAVLAAVFLLGIAVMGRMKGVHTILSLLLTCGAVFWVFLPLVLGGFNIYLSAAAVCVYVTAATLLLVNGPHRKTLVAVAGCSGGLLLAGLLAILTAWALRLTGMASQEAIYLAGLAARKPIDLAGVAFAGILIGAVGAVMDVAMGLSSALWELRCQAARPGFAMLLRSGMNIGRDMMGTMANTLVLAYIGSSLPTVLLLTVYSASAAGLLNREMIAAELVQAIIGSLAILLTVPLTALLASALYPSAAADVLPEAAPKVQKAAPEGGAETTLDGAEGEGGR